ncbi:hypothetical protein FG442_003042 [Yersinia enterocolitica]|uniref:hypothetical protein n=1 Tax=Yersinia enterocolitica TaxID=630 RepID=UPI00061C1CA5|nr:hypothetical protein [Yersinia enterocolitica]EKN3566344.1 hypothetical protein [Yersinia enterocolitica]EKN4885171.1 hypothetical protein [Yersinia enterocolitica]EKN4889780.1 hypothetical protein [Yersinia enterocolitica]EKN4903102.1 hypothetical protein [Yersinia enterocolitica]EKN6154954.1 hypothetical protein [Yersinia enterocolitica]
MDKCSVITLMLLLSGCSSYTIPVDDLSGLSNDDLCIALGERNDNGPMVIRITKEIDSRGGVINQERCYIASSMAIQKSKQEFKVTPYQPPTSYCGLDPQCITPQLRDALLLRNRE